MSGRSLALAQPWDVATWSNKAAKALPPGYRLGGVTTGNGWIGLSAYPVLGGYTPPLRATGSKPYEALARLRAACRADMRITQAALAMCAALGLQPYVTGPYPLGPLQTGVAGGYGGVLIGPGAAETRRNVDWLRPHAAMMAAALDALGADAGGGR